MMNRRVALLGLVAVAALWATTPTHAADPPVTTISVKGMHCQGCASKVASNLQAVKGVSTADVDASKAVAVVIAKESAVPSPKALWEAVEKAGYTPTKLVGPAGTFTKKPKT
jgi:copper chaperone CopZ